jgi:hypothetical protein
MALNDIGLCSRALVRLGANTITSFDDGTAESEIANALYAPTRDALLSAYPWTFATGQLALTKITPAPLADYQNAFQLPGDFLRAISAGNGGRGRGMRYRIFRNALHTDHEAVTLTYIFRPDEAEFPPFFDMAIIARLTAEFCIPVTENTSRAETFSRFAEQEFARARQIDAQQDTPGRIEDFTLIDVR